MALLESGRLPRDILPPINHPDFEKNRSEKNDVPRFPVMPGLSISTAPLGSPTTIYSGPPPPYTRAPSTTESGHGSSGYFSPSDSTTRRSTREENDILSAKTLPSLPSLHEALGGDKSIPFPTAPSAPHSITHGPNSVNTMGPNFSDLPRGPPNPYSHTSAPSHLHINQSQTESLSHKLAATPVKAMTSEPNAVTSHPFLSSPQINNNAHRSSIGSISSSSRPFESVNSTPSFAVESKPQTGSYREHASRASVSQSHPATSFSFEPAAGKFDDSRNPFIRNSTQAPYGDTIKRHLDIYDAEMALNEITEASSRTFEYSRSWSQRYYQGNRSSYFAETAPSLQDVDEMVRQQHRILEGLNRLRDVIVVQQNVMAEQQRVRNARGHPEDDYQNLHDEYKMGGGFAQGDAKKRRGKAAPPGRCHSCNRAETPEWRRGPDGARTLCNACGLHYAKLTRKLGTNKANTITGSNLRPKGLDPRSHV